MKNTYQKFTLLSLALLMVFSPALSYAKEREDKDERREKKEQVIKANAQVGARLALDDDDEEDNDKQDDRGFKSCVKAFGHLIAPGYLKNKGEVDTEFWRDCVLPFGILKKLNNLGTTTPPTVDVIAPVISNLSVSAKINEAVISWKTDERTGAQVYWGTTTPLDLLSASVKSDSSLMRDHRVVLRNLTASTTYYLVVKSEDRAGNVATSSEVSFVTKSRAADVTAPVISGIFVSTGTTTAQVTWKTNESATSRVYWSTLASLDVNATTTASSTNTVLVKNHAMLVSDLAATATYYFKIESADAYGNATTSSVFTATTH